MPTTTIDTFFACSLLVILVVAVMAGMPKILYPFLDGLAHKNDIERFQQLAQYILLNPGTPSDWGSNKNVVLTDFGLASNSALQPYVLDVDKVTRLNSQNIYAVNYAQLLDALRISNIALRIQIDPVFNTSITLVTSVNNGNSTSYFFEITTQNSGLGVVSNLMCYVVVGNYLDGTSSFTNSNGKANVTVTLPNNLDGNALLVVLAKAQVNPSIVSFGTYAFSHNSSPPKPNGTFIKLSPLDYRLNATFNYPNLQILGKYAISYGYWSNLTQLTNTTQSAQYAVPRFLDKSPTILVLTGLNGTEPFAEWVAYPQIPLRIGVNFDASNFRGSNVASFTYLVTIGGALYRLQITCREVS
ncbi:MAG: hypothetical protein QXM22_02605 [Candidatus Bathyarchaeia archaeon]